MDYFESYYRDKVPPELEAHDAALVAVTEGDDGSLRVAYRPPPDRSFEFPFRLDEVERPLMAGYVWGVLSPTADAPAMMHGLALPSDDATEGIMWTVKREWVDEHVEVEVDADADADNWKARFEDLSEAESEEQFLPLITAVAETVRPWSP